LAKNNKLANLDKAMQSAAMNEASKTRDNSLKKRKIITIPIEWEKRIKEQYPGSFSSYILMALKEKMDRDNI
jgi:phage gp36-like protein